MRTKTLRPKTPRPKPPLGRLASVLALLLAAPLVACRSSSQPTPYYEGPAAPQPYTLAQIRASNAPVTTLVYHITEPEQPTYVQVRVFVSADEEGARVVTTTETRDGEQGYQADMEVPWQLLHDLTRYPADGTVRVEEPVTVAAGTFDSWHYTVQGDWGEAPAVRHYWFDVRTAGSPVLFTVERDGAEVYRMELVEHDRHPIPDDGEETAPEGVDSASPAPPEGAPQTGSEQP